MEKEILKIIPRGFFITVLVGLNLIVGFVLFKFFK